MHEDLPPLGSTVGPWLILERLDSGSFGVVFRARRANHPESTPVALKLAKRPGDPRFEREAEMLRRSHHPSIPRYEDMGLWTGPRGRSSYPYLAMEWVKGFTLYHWFRNEQRSSLDVLQVVVQLAEALASAHGRGVVHRDVKGDNIRVTPEGRAVLLDWGSCWLPSAPPLTDTPAPPGTSAYRPPEQRGFMYASLKDMEARWESRPSDDLYALGVTLYRLVTGTYLPPCTNGDGLVEREVLKPSEMATVSRELEAIILRLISDDREARGTAEQLVREAMALIQAEGRNADRPILPTPSVQPAVSGRASSDAQDDVPASGESDTGSARQRAGSVPPPSRSSSTRAGRRRRRGPTVATWLSWAGASAAGALVMALVVLLVVLPSRPKPQPTPPPWLATPEEVEQFAPDAGVGEEALLSVTRAPSPPALSTLVSASMPKTPLPGQKKPPCSARFEREVLGVCWSILKGEPPCGKDGYDYDGECLRASFDGPRQPTSAQP